MLGHKHFWVQKGQNRGRLCSLLRRCLLVLRHLSDSVHFPARDSTRVSKCGESDLEQQDESVQSKHYLLSVGLCHLPQGRLRR